MQLLEILGRIGFDWQVALANLVNFLIIFWILKRFVFRPMSETIDKRRELVSKGFEEKKRAEEELAQARSEKEAIINQAKQEAGDILENAKSQGSSLVEKAREDANLEAQEIIVKARKEINMEKDSVKRALQNDAAILVSSAVRKIIEEDITTEKAEKFVNSLLAERK